MLEDTRERVSDLTNQGVEYSKEHPWIAAGVGVSSLFGLYLLRKATRSEKVYSKKPRTGGLSGGGIDRDKVHTVYKDYYDSYGKDAGAGITDRSRTTELVDTFYNMVTDVYEWGWGQSFHFSPLLPGKDWASSEAAHEARLPAVLGLHKGKEALDVGCGVGGPMRTIASTSGAHVTGITINDYQVKRAKHHNEKLGLQSLCNPTQGDFLNMPFAENTFDAAYAIEATCHAPVLKDVYAEILRILKPGGRFASYEWVSTPKFDPKNPEHVKIIDDINYGNGLPEMRTWKEAEQAGKDAGFELVSSYDVATQSDVAGPWYSKLLWLGSSGIIKVNSALVRFFSLLRICPKGMQDVHDMLVNVAVALCAGGQTGIFTPMHLLVFQKPVDHKKDGKDGQSSEEKKFKK